MAMHIYFSGIGGTGIGPLSLIAKQAGYAVSGSDKQDSQYVEHLRSHGITNIHIGQNREAIAKLHAEQPIDWFVYSSALPLEDPNHPELMFCKEQGIKTSKRDELLNQILEDKQLQLIAIAGTHGKTTTTAMAIWLFKQLGLPISYAVGAKVSDFDMGHYDPASRFFVYECDEYDRNFLSFTPHVSLITGIGWDHPDIYPTREGYDAAFREFIEQSEQTYLWQADAEQLNLQSSERVHVLQFEQYAAQFTLAGNVNRRDAALVAQAIAPLLDPDDFERAVAALNAFPGVSRRFEQIIAGLYSDYAHTPPKIRGVLQLAHEVAGDKLVVVYEGLHNTRQHFIKEELEHLFDGVKQLYIVPSYLAREDQSLKLLSQADLKLLMSPETQAVTQPANLDGDLARAITQHIADGDIVLCLTAGGGGSLDEWLRQEFGR
jgi:UDP-N-acetylmuramate--alanine ligase